MDRPDLGRALTLARAALAAAPAGLLTDLDGTLAPIVRDPAAARALPGAGEALAKLASGLAVVAVVSGRAASDARRILGREDVLVIGNHGLEWLEPGAAEASTPTDLGAPGADLHAVLAALPASPGVTVEDKRLSATIHVRNAPDPGAAGEALEAWLGANLPASLVLRRGRMSLELRPAGAGDKGTALTALVERHGLRGVVLLGDDVTDLDMFRAAIALRSEGGVRAAILAVAGEREVPPEVAASADAVLQSPRAVVDLLRALARDLSGAPRSWPGR
ncbi:MAG TPA: trehalose-phosphatase [Candidatus Limnocylindria bacterium]